MELGFLVIQFGMTRPENMEKPKMKMFLEEFMSVYWQIETESHHNVHNGIMNLCIVFQTVFNCIYLKIRNPSCGNHSEHDHEHSSHHGRWDGGENSTDFTKHTHDHHRMPLAMITVRLPTCKHVWKCSLQISNNINHFSSLFFYERYSAQLNYFTVNSDTGH